MTVNVNGAAGDAPSAARRLKSVTRAVGFKILTPRTGDVIPTCVRRHLGLKGRSLPVASGGRPSAA